VEALLDQVMALIWAAPQTIPAQAQLRKELGQLLSDTALEYANSQG
jgi:hypothetical protein